ncbi:MAG: hypothetical protein ACRD07_09390 [Acidimicrobiales bacterium]
MPSLEELEKLVDGVGCSRSELWIVHGFEGAEDVVRVLGPLVGDLTGLDDRLGFLDSELLVWVGDVAAEEDKPGGLVDDRVEERAVGTNGGVGCRRAGRGEAEAGGGGGFRCLARPR